MKEKQIDKQLWSCYDELAAAIIQLAIDDWRELIKRGTKIENWQRLIEQGEDIENITIKGNGSSFNELRRFFKSENCEILMQGMKLKPAHILAMLENDKREAGL